MYSGRHGHAISSIRRGKSSACRQIKAFCPQLEVVDKRQVGVGDNTGLCNRPGDRASTEAQTSPPCGEPGSSGLSRTRNSCINGERGGVPDNPITEPVRVLLKSVSGPKERRSTTTCHQSEVVERIRSTSAFQNGGSQHPSRFNPAQGLASQSRPEGCVFRDPNKGGSQEIPSFSGGSEGLSVQLPTFRPVLCSMGLYQDPEASCGPSQRDGSPHDSVHQRHSPLGGVQGGVNQLYPSPGVSPRNVGLHCEQREICINPDTGNRIPGVYCEFRDDGVKTSIGQTEENQSGVASHVSIDYSSVCQITVASVGEDECSGESYPTGSPVLPKLAEGSVSYPEQQRPELRGAPDAVGGSEGRPAMVEYLHSTVERETPLDEGLLPHHHIGCLPQGVGGSLRGPEDRRSMVQLRKPVAHQLPGASSSILGITDICKKKEQNIYLAEAGQHDCCVLHQRSGGYCVFGVDQSSKVPLAVVSGEGYHSSGTTCGQSDSRCGVSAAQGQVRLDAQSSGIQEGHFQIRPCDDRPVCFQANNADSSVLQLAPRSTSTGNRCFSPGLEQDEGLCQSPLVSDRQSPCSDTQTRSRRASGGSSMEDTTLVCCVAEHAGGHSKPDPKSGQPDDTSVRPSTSSGSTTSRVEYLWEKCKSQSLSGQATELLLSSWREKTSKSYDSLFGKWMGWCGEQHCDPFSGPVSHVVNFLAYLFENGYQYRSLNAYRSAISSVHVHVDGVAVGQHPLVTRLMKGVYHSRPPLPRYTSTWNVDRVLFFLESLDPLGDLSLKDLTFKTVMLLALTRPSRSVDLAKLDIRSVQRVLHSCRLFWQNSRVKVNR